MRTWDIWLTLFLTVCFIIASWVVVDTLWGDYAFLACQLVELAILCGVAALSDRWMW